MNFKVTVLKLLHMVFTLLRQYFTISTITIAAVLLCSSSHVHSQLQLKKDHLEIMSEPNFYEKDHLFIKLPVSIILIASLEPALYTGNM